MDKLNGCPFCGSTPKIDSYPSFIRIFCEYCKEQNRTVDVFGDGHYSEWLRQQKPDKNGLIQISSELNPVSDTRAFSRLVEKWNYRALSSPQSIVSEPEINEHKSDY